MDIIDDANAAAEMHRLASLRRRVVESIAPATGACFNCDTTLPDLTHRWCDADCRDDWFKRRKEAK